MTNKTPKKTLELKNGTKAKFMGLDDWHRKLYEYEYNGKKFI